MLAEGPMDARCRATREVIEVYLGDLTSNATMLTAEKLNQYYGESHILWDAHLAIRSRARCTCLMGRNGVGKTTLLR